MNRVLRTLPIALTILSLLPQVGSGQERWRAFFVETGLSSGPQGTAKTPGIRAELGLAGPVRATFRWSQRQKVLALASDGGANPTNGDFLELGFAVGLRRETRVVPFGELLLGACNEKKPYRSKRTTYTSGSASIGLDLRVWPPVTLRLGLRRQEVFGTNRSDGKRGSGNGFFAGLGLTSW